MIISICESSSAHSTVLHGGPTSDWQNNWCRDCRDQPFFDTIWPVPVNPSTCSIMSDISCLWRMENDVIFGMELGAATLYHWHEYIAQRYDTSTYSIALCTVLISGVVDGQWSGLDGPQLIFIWLHAWVSSIAAGQLHQWSTRGSSWTFQAQGLMKWDEQFDKHRQQYATGISKSPDTRESGATQTWNPASRGY